MNRQFYDLAIERAVTGFIVRNNHMCQSWAFETPEALAKFIKDWAKNTPKT